MFKTRELTGGRGLFIQTALWPCSFHDNRDKKSDTCFVSSLQGTLDRTRKCAKMEIKTSFDLHLSRRNQAEK